MSATSTSEPRWGLSGSRVCTPEGVRPAVVVVRGETIEAVLDPAGAPREMHLVEAGDAHVLPGLVDAHVHVNEPGRTEWEGFVTATRAAAAGGVTTVVDMPLNCIPVTTSAEALATKLAEAEDELWVDTAFWGGVVGQSPEQLAALARAGVRGAKAFLCDSGIDEFPAVGEDALRPAMEVLAAAGIPLLAHAEVELGVDTPPASAPRAYASYLASRPASWEEAAIELLVRLSRDTGCAVHVVHLSAASALPILAAARAEGLPVTVETCPHYLVLAAEDVPDGATQFKCAPPIRERANREALWRGLADRTIDMITSDHSPCTPALKRIDEGDFAAAWGGISSLQLGLPLVWTAATERGFGPDDVVRWLAAAPARLAGLARKGRIAPGCDADLVVFDAEASSAVDPAALETRHKLTPYAGHPVRGRVTATYLRGEPVFADGRCRGPRGRALLREASP